MPEDPWGTTEAPAGNVRVAFHDPAAPRKSAPRVFKAKSRDFPTLYRICLGLLAEHVEEVLELGELVQPYLPADARLTLLAVARRKEILDDAALATLVDGDWTALDVATSAVTHDGLLSALRQLPRLRALDLSWCENLGPATLREAARLCPSLETLRVGGSSNAVAAAEAALQYIVPLVRPSSGSAAGESWEELPDPDSTLCAEGRLAHLRHLVYHWPLHGAVSLAMLRALCPRLACNPQPGRAPEVADPAIDLDEPALDALAHLGVAGHKAWLVGYAPRGAGNASGTVEAPSTGSGAAVAARKDFVRGPALPSLAERFKAAYASRAAKLSAEHARNLRRAERRRLAALGGAERAMRMAELGVPLARLRR
ncbi:hypothetical protein WJX81_005159 [Elliptochloris bilobata]|uniref:Uncharacterized protein n=1 Tax=Elliptochloris bilobata TaxID=381761 RepID=A0AAW1RWL2_9CHLO